MSPAEAEDVELCKLLDRMVPVLKRVMLPDSDKRPDLLNLEIVLLSSILQVRKELLRGQMRRPPRSSLNEHFRAQIHP